MKITIETTDLTEARVLLRAAYEYKASHLVPVTEQGQQLGIPTDANNTAVDAIAGHDALVRQEPPEKSPCAPCADKAKQAEYDALVSGGLSDYEARETVWPTTLAAAPALAKKKKGKRSKADAQAELAQSLAAAPAPGGHGAAFETAPEVGAIPDTEKEPELAGTGEAMSEQITEVEIHAAVREYAATHGAPAILGVVQALGYRRVVDIPSEKWPELLHALGRGPA